MNEWEREIRREKDGRKGGKVEGGEERKKGRKGKKKEGKKTKRKKK